MSGYTCPSCREPMLRRGFARRPGGTVELDICFPCRSIWFDEYESAQLAPGAVLELFRDIQQALQKEQVVRPMGDSMRCPVDHRRLSLTHDVIRTNRITYHRCEACRGRLTSFLQFMREKQFVRSLSPVEIEKLRAEVKQVRCTGCGAPVDIERDAQCKYCHAPIAVLDAEAMNKVIAELGDAERKRGRVDPQGMIDAMIAGKKIERLAGTEAPRSWETRNLDLVGDAIGAFMTFLLDVEI